MSLFPQFSPTYYTEKDRPILSKMEAFYAEAVTINQAYWAEADSDLRFEAGDQTIWSDIYGNMPINRRRQFNFNRIRRVINVTDGYQRRNRKSIVATPVENGDDVTADQLTKILLWINNQEGVLETISDAFHGALVTGLNFLEVWMDYRNDPISGNIKVDNCPYNYFLVDPYFKKMDMSDCNGVWKRSFLTKKEVISLMPDKVDEILPLVGNPYGSGRDGKFQFAAESYNYNINNLLTYDQFYYRDYRTQKILVDKNTGETQEWRGTDNDRLKLYLKTYPEIEMIEQEIPTVSLAVVVQGKVLYHGPNPLGIDRYPLVPVWAYYNPQLAYFPYRVQGMVRGLRDAQYLYNRRRIIELDILESQIASGFKYKENALVNPEDIFLQGQGKGLALKNEAAMTDVEQIRCPEISPSMTQLSELLAKEVMEISGVNEELLGSAADDKAGILSMLRQGAGLTTLQILFDNLDRSQKLLGQIMLELIQTNFAPGKVKKILNGEEPSAQFYNKAFGKYGIVVEDGINTTTQKQMQFSLMLQLKEVGVPIPDDALLEACTLPDKKNLIDRIMQNKQAQDQLVQQQAQIQMEEVKSRIELANARAAADKGLGAERYSRIDENMALAIERLAQSKKDAEAARLDKIRVLKELDGLDISHIEKLINLANTIDRNIKEPSESLEAQNLAQFSKP